jgi:hypothetical protein
MMHFKDLNFNLKNRSYFNCKPNNNIKLNLLDKKDISMLN